MTTIIPVVILAAIAVACAAFVANGNLTAGQGAFFVGFAWLCIFVEDP